MTLSYNNKHLTVLYIILKEVNFKAKEKQCDEVLNMADLGAAASW